MCSMSGLVALWLLGGCVIAGPRVTGKLVTWSLTRDPATPSSYRVEEPVEMAGDVVVGDFGRQRPRL